MEVPKIKKKVNLQLDMGTSDEDFSAKSSEPDKQNLYLEEEE